MSTRSQIPDSFIQEVLARVDIVDIVGRHVTLKKGGANLLGLCPFHGEKSPSFTVSPSKQFYHCFGCGAHGDAIRFLMEHAGMGFIDAVRELAQQVGLQVPQTQLDPAQEARAAEARERQTNLTDVLLKAQEHFTKKLKESPQAIDYLKGRGLTGLVAKQFGLGYAPTGWRHLASVFARYDDPLLEEAGLVIVQGDEGPEQKRYDRFRDRIMFPIRSVKGEVIGFGGRVLDAGEPKYLNSPETPVFVKGRELYGLYEARASLREKGYALVVEGYMDVVALAQWGFGNAVATLGTACTADHVKKLLRFTDHVVFSFDGDAAGRRAAARALEAALPHVNDLRTFRFLFLPAEHDPDSYVREFGQASFEDQVSAAVPLSAQLVHQCSEGLDLTQAEGRARMLAQARPLWSALPSCALKTQILAALARTAEMPLDELSRLWGLSAGSSNKPSRPGWSARSAPASPARPLTRTPQDQLVRILMANAGLWDSLSPEDHELLSEVPSWQGLALQWLERTLTDQGVQEWPVLRQQLAEQAEPFAEKVLQLIDGSDIVITTSAEDLGSALQQLRRSLTLEKADTLRLLGRR